ncbi:MAG TPA: polysaccharide biosynthesis/export family protein [Vicinamibacterales bacterium]|jgi:polysaccharide export outer membrane protein
MTKPFWSLVTAAMLVSVLPAIAQSPQPPAGAGTLVQPTSATGSAPDARYRLRSGDVIELDFPFVATFNQTLTVQPDGDVALHARGALHVDGLTLAQLTETLRSEYSSILRDPIVTVRLKEFEKPYFIVAGEVERPGKYDLRGATTVTQAVAIAGGLRERAKQSEVVVFRQQREGGVEARKLDLKKMLKDAQLRDDVRLIPGDMLFVPRGRHVNIGELTPSLWILSLLR